MNIIETGIRWLTESIFGADPINIIQDEQARITRIQARAQEKVSVSALNIEDAVDFEIDNIRATVAAGFGRIGQIISTGVVSDGAQTALVKAQAEISVALKTLDAAVY